MKNSSWIRITVALALCGGPALAMQGSWQVTIVDLPLLPGGRYSSAYGVNDSGKIVGVADDASGALKTVEWVNGQIAVIPDLGSGLAVPEDVNDAGEIVGHQNLGVSLSHAVYWNPQNVASALPGLPNGSTARAKAHAINVVGEVAGFAQEVGANLYGHAVVWSQGSLVADLGFMGGGTYSEAYGINDLGAVVGVASIANTNQHAFLWQNGQFTDLGAWSGGGAASKAFAINNVGEIVGLNSSVASVWRNGAVQALPMPPGVSAFTPAIDINDAGDIIATGMVSFPNEVGVLWRNGSPISLGYLPGGTISRVRRINQAGEIVGEARASSGFFHAVKWIVSAPASTYCTAKVNSQGCTPAIAASGAPSASSTTAFTLSASQVLNRQNGIFFYGFAQQVAPFQGGFKCMSNPIKRTPVQNSGGSSLPTVDCSGVYSIDFNAWVQTGIDPLLGVGVEVDGQFWSRDSGSTSTTGLTDAVHFVIGA